MQWRSANQNYDEGSALQVTGVRATDYVRIGDVEGQVLDVGFLATKLRTARQ
ncbi:MAG: mechanosensitive ion channel domain-containing protein, partial [Candidatus Binatia bacterium]